MELCSFVIPCCYRSVTQFCPTLCDPMDCRRFLRPPLSPGVCSNSCPSSRWCYLTISFSESPFSFGPNLSQGACVLSQFSHVWFFETPCTIAHQAPLSMGLSRQEYWSGLPYPPPGDLPDPGIEPASLLSPALAGRLFTTRATWEIQSFPA